MSQRLLDTTKWLWCLLVIQASSIKGQPHPIRVQTPTGGPTTVEAQAKFFQDFFSVQLSPYKMEFGHVCEDPDTWEQRYEKKDFKNHRDMGKVRWGDKKGGYGEHYWDLNHAGHTGNHGNDGYDGDDGSYHDSGHNDPYNEPNDSSPHYDHDDYDSEKSSYEESGRAKRAHPKIKVERKHKQSETYEEESKQLKPKHKRKEELQATATNLDEEYAANDDDEEDEDEDYEKPKPKRQQHKKQNENQQQTNQQQPKEKNQYVLVVSQKDDSEKQKQVYQPQYSKRKLETPQYLPKKQPDVSQYAALKQPELSQYVPYESGAGVRQYLQPEVSAATTVPRLFLEPSTGHVVDRATGQAYVLQPIAQSNNYNN